MDSSACIITTGMGEGGGERKGGREYRSAIGEEEEANVEVLLGGSRKLM